MAKSLAETNLAFPIRFWIVDNSRSMVISNGCQKNTLNSQAKVRMVDCTHWKQSHYTK